MATISKENFIQMVRIELDRNRTSSALLSNQHDPDTLELEDIIEQQIIPALRWCLERAPIDYLGDAVKVLPTSGRLDPDDPTSPYITQNYTFTPTKTPATNVGSIILPSDYLRLVLFQMYDWSVAATQEDVITEGDPRAAMFGSKYAAIAGHEERPTLLLTFNEDGQKILVYFTSEDGDVEAARKLYVAEPAETNSNYDIPTKMLPAAVAMCAAMTDRTLQDTAGVQLLEQKAFALLGITPKETN